MNNFKSKSNSDPNTNPYNLPPLLLKRVEQFSRIDDATKKYQRIIELGKKLPQFPESLKTEENQVKGCTSVTYISGENRAGLIYYQGDSNSSIVRGLVAVLVESLSGLSPEAILKIDPKFIEAMGLTETLTMSRANGFANTFAMMLSIANQIQTRSQSPT